MYYQPIKKHQNKSLSMDVLVILFMLAGVVLADIYTYTELSKPRSTLGSAGGNNLLMFGYGTDGSDSNVINMYDVRTRTWFDTSYGIARQYVAGAYADGYMAFAGGLVGTSLREEITVYEIKSGSFSGHTLNKPRYSTAAAGNQEMILFGGGFGLSRVGIDAVDIFFTNNQSTSAISFGSMKARGDVCAVAAGNNILFAGGADKFVPYLEIDVFDVSVGSWVAILSLSVARYGIGGAGVGDMAYFAGGIDWSGNPSDIVEIYNVTSGIWNFTSLSIARGGIAAAADQVEGLIFFGGGDDTSEPSNRLDIYDTNTESWHVSSLSNHKMDLTATSYGNITMFAGGIYSGLTYQSVEAIETTAGCRPRTAMTAGIGNKTIFAGGEGGGPNGSITYSTINIYDVISDKWSTAALSTPMKDGAAAVAGEYLYVGGGNYLEAGDELDIVETYRITDDSRANKTLVNARAYLAAAGLGNIIVFAGGYPETTLDVDIFDVVLDTHYDCALSQHRFKLAAGTVGTRMYFVGGTNGTHAQDAVDIYDSAAGFWMTDAIDIARYNLVGVSAGDFVFFAGGENGTHYFDGIDVWTASSTVRSTMSLAYRRSQFAGAANADGTFAFFAGGINEEGILGSVEIYNTVCDSWELEYLSVPSYKLSAAASANYIVILAGVTEKGTYSCKKDVFQTSEPVCPTSSSTSISSSSMSLSSMSTGSSSESSISSALSSSLASSTSSTSSISSESSNSSTSSQESASTSSTPSSSTPSSSTASSSTAASEGTTDLLSKCIETPACLFTAMVAMVLVVVAVIIVAILIVIVIVAALISFNFFGYTMISRRGNGDPDNPQYEEEMEYYEEETNSAGSLNRRDTSRAGGSFFTHASVYSEEAPEVVNMTQHPHPLQIADTNSRSPFLDDDNIQLPPEIDDE